jgi:hypothetical protein
MKDYPTTKHLHAENTQMAHFVSPPQFDEATGEYIGEPIVENREMMRGINTVSYEDIDPNEYNDALEPHYARKAIQANLPIFDENASDEAVVAFWRRNEPLTDAEVDAIMSAYVATDSEQIAALLQWKLTGDDSQLSEEQRYQLGLDDDNSEDYVEANEGDFTEEQVIEFENYLVENSTDPNPDVAQSILAADIGDTDAAKAVQYLAYQYYNGSISLEDAYEQALSTGIPERQLYSAFYSLHQQTNK